MAKINIIARTNGVGLDQDVDLIHHALSSAGFAVTVSHCRGISPFRLLIPSKTKFDANIFLERVFPRWLGIRPPKPPHPQPGALSSSRHLKHLKHIERHPLQEPPRRGQSSLGLAYPSTIHRLHLLRSTG